MNRQKKKISHSSDEDDQVSIFDSEEEQEPTHKKNQIKSSVKNHKKIQIVKNNKIKPPKKITVKSREKKLSKEEDDIMKKLIKEEEKSRQSTESDKNDQDEGKIDYKEVLIKRESTYDVNQEDEWKDDSNPYEEIPLMEDYSITKDNPSEPIFGNYTQQTASHDTIAYSNIYNNTSSQLYNPQQHSFQQYTPQQISSYQQPPYQYYPSNMDPSMELNFQDFEQVNYDDEKTWIYLNMQDIEQLKEEVDLEKKIETQQESSNNNKWDSKYRKRRMNYILSQIEKLKKQYIELQNLTADSCEAQQKKQETCNLLKEWKYDPTLLKKPEKPKIEQETKTNEEAPKSKTEGRIAMLNEVLTENPFLTQVEMADVLRVMDPVMNARIERSVVLRLLKMCGFKKKKVRGICKERNTSLSLALRSEYAHKFKEHANSEVYYFDELILNEYFDKESGWCRAEEEVEFRPERFIDRSVVVMAVLSARGVCKWDVRFGDYQPEDYCKTFRNLLKISESEAESNRLLVVKPLPYRDPHPIIEMVERRGWDMLVLPPDGLGLNPLQSYFADVRDIMKRKRYDTIQTLFQSVVEVLQDADKQGLANKMLDRVQTYLQKALRKELL